VKCSVEDMQSYVDDLLGRLDTITTEGVPQDDDRVEIGGGVDVVPEWPQDHQDNSRVA